MSIVREDFVKRMTAYSVSTGNGHTENDFIGLLDWLAYTPIRDVESNIKEFVRVSEGHFVQEKYNYWMENTRQLREVIHNGNRW